MNRKTTNAQANPQENRDTSTLGARDVRTHNRESLEALLAHVDEQCRARCEKICRMSIVRSRTWTLPPSASCRLRPCAGDSSSSNTTLSMRCTDTVSLSSSTLPEPRKVDGEGCCIACVVRPITSSPAVSHSRPSSSSDEATSHDALSVLYFFRLISEPTSRALAPSLTFMTSAPKTASALIE